MHRRQFIATSTLALASGAMGIPLANAKETPPAAVASPGDASSAEREIPALASLNDLEAMAKANMPAGVFAHIALGAGNQLTFQENFRSIERVKIKPAYLSNDVAADLKTRVLGSELRVPFYTCPMGSHGIVHVNAEAETSRGTGAAGAAMVMSSAANRTVEQVAQSNPDGVKWLQLYITADPALNRQVLQDAKKAGFTAVMVTIDTPAQGISDEVVRLGYKFPKLPKPYLPHGIKPRLVWSDLEAVKRETDLPVLVKGVLTPELAREAIKRGFDGVVVSNHGGRQLDGVPGAMEVLPSIVEAVDGRGVVLMDGGIRRGADAFKALALGADAVGIGRPVLFALSVGGWKGIQSAYARLEQELAFSMNVAEAPSIATLDRRFIY